MTAIQQLFDKIEQLKRLDAYGTLAEWLSEHLLFTAIVLLAATVWTLMTIDDITKPKYWKDSRWRKR